MRRMSPPTAGISVNRIHQALRFVSCSRRADTVRAGRKIARVHIPEIIAWCLKRALSISAASTNTIAWKTMKNQYSVPPARPRKDAYLEKTLFMACGIVIVVSYVASCTTYIGESVRGLVTKRFVARLGSPGRCLDHVAISGGWPETGLLPTSYPTDYQKKRRLLPHV
jgi:hypothetical protein